jgi:hypothetical protein
MSKRTFLHAAAAACLGLALFGDGGVGTVCAQYPERAIELIVAEQGFPSLEAVASGGLIAPVGLPSPVLERRSQPLQEAVSAPAVQERRLAAGTENGLLLHLPLFV